jgi:hypothetical protein
MNGRSILVGFALALVFGLLAAAQTLSGSLNMTIAITPSPLSLSIDSEAIVTAAVMGWSFTSDSTFDLAGWKNQKLNLSGTLGSVTVGSILAFNPSLAAFESLDVAVTLALAAVTFTPKLEIVPTGLQVEAMASWSSGPVAASADATFGDETGCDLGLSGVKVDLSLALCCAKFRSEAAFTCDGFEYATFATDGVAIPYLPWVKIYALVKFTPTAKTLQLTPVFDFSAPECFTIYVSQDASGGLSPEPLALDGITFDGIGLDCTIGDIEFVGVSYWGAGTKPSLLSGTPYWEAYQIKTRADACCGLFAFDVTAYFLEEGLQLFDISQVVANASLQLTTGLVCSTGMVFDLALPSPWAKWTFEVLVTW